MESGIILGIVVLTAIVFITLYNKLVTQKNHYKNAFKQIDVQLTRRYELIPNLVETAKGYMQHEKETLEAVINARNMAQQANQNAAGNPTDAARIKELAAAETLLTGTLGKLFALSENYPDLKANETMNRLMEELTSTENKVAFSRQAFNDSVMQYNITRETFPSNIVAGMFNFEPAQLWEMQDPAAREAIKVSFN
ncbi:LemA family protein [Aliikangiella maris]|uniref:LemA family protein n=2 Tax=Aliikangiella maris TaxID=3162458 RepID=A0ABV2BRM9_9GAMM